MDNKIKALAEYLGIEESAVKPTGFDSYETDCNEYLVLTEEEANQKTKEYIEDSLWAFDTGFILYACDLNNTEEVSCSLRKMQEDSCEGCNDFIRALVDGTCGIDEFVDQAIIADGRGHFLSSYDGEEGEQDGYFIYCIG